MWRLGHPQETTIRRARASSPDSPFRRRNRAPGIARRFRQRSTGSVNIFAWCVRRRRSAGAAAAQGRGVAIDGSPFRRREDLTVSSGTAIRSSVSRDDTSGFSLPRLWKSSESFVVDSRGISAISMSARRPRREGDPAQIEKPRGAIGLLVAWSPAARVADSSLTPRGGRISSCPTGQEAKPKPCGGIARSLTGQRCRFGSRDRGDMRPCAHRIGRGRPRRSATGWSNAR